MDPAWNSRARPRWSLTRPLVVLAVTIACGNLLRPCLSQPTGAPAGVTPSASCDPTVDPSCGDTSGNNNSTSSTPACFSPCSGVENLQQSNGTFDVTSFGAVGDNSTDDTTAFLRAICSACRSDQKLVFAPANKTYRLKPICVSTPCSGLRIEINGTVVAPRTITDWPADSNGFQPLLQFRNQNGITLAGHGTIEGSGQPWWDAVHAKTKLPASRPRLVAVHSSSNFVVANLTLRNSPSIHISVNRCSNLSVSGVQIFAPETSPNTDGVDVGSSSNILIEGAIIANGDDAVAVGANVTNMLVSGLVVSSGHGTSIGSLGSGGGTAYVSGILFQGITYTSTTAGAHIKTWQGGHGQVSDITFQNLVMNDVKNPIYIDQYYCPHSTCANQTSAVAIKGVTFRNVAGTASNNGIAGQFFCSDSVPCTGITLENIILSGCDGCPQPQFQCWQASGSSLFVMPPSCLQPEVA